MATTATTGGDTYHNSMFDLLDKNTTKKFYIEYKNYLSNHTSHGLFALYKLNAPLKCATHFEKCQEDKIEGADRHREREEREDPKGDIDALLGARKSYYYIYDHYEKLFRDVYGGSLERLIVGEFPKLSGGMLGSALHPLIHLGYGYAAGRPWFVLEGLAYFHHSYVPLNISQRGSRLKTLGLGSHNILDVVEMIHNDADLTDIIKNIPEHLNDFDNKKDALLTSKTDDLACYVDMVQFPESLSANNFHLDKTTELARWLIDVAIIVYATAENVNDFFLLHGVTSSWAMKNILLCLNDREHVLAAAHTFLFSLFTVYLIQCYPHLQTELLEKNDGMLHDWDDLIKRTIENEEPEGEHIYKLVQVCKEMSEGNTDPTMEAVYRLACYNSVANHFVY